MRVGAKSPTNPQNLRVRRRHGTPKDHGTFPRQRHRQKKNHPWLRTLAQTWKYDAEDKEKMYGFEKGLRPAAQPEEWWNGLDATEKADWPALMAAFEKKWEKPKPTVNCLDRGTLGQHVNDEDGSLRYGNSLMQALAEPEFEILSCADHGGWAGRKEGRKVYNRGGPVEEHTGAVPTYMCLYHNTRNETTTDETSPAAVCSALAKFLEIELEQALSAIRSASHMQQARATHPQPKLRFSRRDKDRVVHVATLAGVVPVFMSHRALLAPMRTMSPEDALVDDPEQGQNCPHFGWEHCLRHISLNTGPISKFSVANHLRKIALYQCPWPGPDRQNCVHGAQKSNLCDSIESQPPFQLGTLFAPYLAQYWSNLQVLGGESTEENRAVPMHLAWARLRQNRVHSAEKSNLCDSFVPPFRLGTLFAAYLAQYWSNLQALSGELIQKIAPFQCTWSEPDWGKTACAVLGNPICAIQLTRQVPAI
ncbi:hypothetical protein B0H11DRAFT_1939511 [Mycena galericulata]|nr:hypothetical protein B0H11DRAFT_1939511 [Mycena galericulata]